MKIKLTTWPPKEGKENKQSLRMSKNQLRIDYRLKYNKKTLEFYWKTHKKMYQPCDLFDTNHDIPY